MRCGVAGHVEIIGERTAALGEFDIHVLTSNDPSVDPSIARGYMVHPKIADWTPWQAGQICQEILALKPDVVHAQIPTVKYTGWRSFTLSLVGRMLKKRAPALRLVVMQHDIAVGRPILRLRYKPLLVAADAITVSNSRDSQAIRDLGIDETKIHTTPVGSHIEVHPLNDSTRQVCRGLWHIHNDALCIATFGFVHPGRHIHLLVRSLAQLLDQGRDFHALILGGPARGTEIYYQRCKLLAESLGLTPFMDWTGYAGADTIADGLAAADLFVSLPDRGADMRNTSIHTALLAGLPVVTTRNEKYYVDEQIERLGCITISDFTPETLTQAILRAADDPPPLESRLAVAAELDPERIWSRHTEVNCELYRGH